MNKIKDITFTLFLFLSFLSFSSAQNNKIPKFDSHHKNISVELFGSHISWGINFDMRLKKGQMDGIGFRAGIGGYVHKVENRCFVSSNYSIGVFTFPLEFNYLVGIKRSYFVAGVGLLPVYSTTQTIDIGNDQIKGGDNFEIVGGFFTLGYRFQPIKTGFTFQINWNPIILTEGEFDTAWFGLSAGIGFK